MTMIKYLLLSLCTGAMLTGCGSSSNGDDNSFGLDYKGESSAYVLNEESKMSVAYSSEEAIIALSSPQSSMTLSNRAQISASNAQEVMDLISETLSYEAGTENIPNTTVDGSCGGSLTVKGNFQKFSFSASSFCVIIDEYNVTVSGSATYTANENTVNISYDRFAFSSDDPSVEDVSINGEIGVAFLDSGLTMSINADITSNDISESLTYNWECDESFNCTFDAIFKSPEGTIFKVDNTITEFSGNSVNYVTNLYLPEFGKLSVETEGLTFCDDGSIETGQILLYDEEDNVLEIIYEQCGVEPIITFDQIITIQ